ncbi:hypothetical protein DENSPDRAFT_832513 [Dentipellis sp. KUC8613]|nr:hypothetical protein DENSPDRAFT_832513 [Dentipellis sp. KUC8613]
MTATTSIPLNPNTTLCLACASSLPPRLFTTKLEGGTSQVAFSPEVFLTRCCNRPICPSCLSHNPRLSRYHPCLACLAGVSAVGTKDKGKQRLTDPQIPVNVDGGVKDEDVFILGDEDDAEDTAPGGGETDMARSSPPPPYSTDLPSPSSQTPAPIHDLSESSSGVNSPDSSNKGQSSTPDKYHIKPGDTLTGIALRFGVDGRALCRLNKLPPSTLSTTPHLLHTRTSLLLPPSAKVHSTLVEPIFDAEEEERRAQARTIERAQKRFQFVTKEVDWRIARTYVALADGESPMHQGAGEKGHEDVKDGSRLKQVGNPGREATAVDRYLDDEEWEANERRQGRGVHIQRIPGTGSRAGESSSGTSRSSQWNKLSSLWGK